MKSLPYVIQFEPIYKEKIWGGRKLESVFGRKIPNGPIGESWEVSVYGTDISRAKNDLISGESFTELISKYPKEILGSAFEKDSFPLLIKLIDAKEKLSVQVHPDDLYAEKYDPDSSGKKECWYVLEADPGAQIVVGFQREISKSEFTELVSKNECEVVLRNWKVNPGDVFLLNPGTIHAIGAGVVLLEVQQSSDSTYRVYDYGRLGDDGKPRSLHLEKALAVLNFSKSTGDEYQTKNLVHYQPFTRYFYTSNDKFRLESWEFSQAQYLSIPAISKPSTFCVFYVTSGSIYFEHSKQLISKGESFLITADGMQSGIKAYLSAGTSMAVMTAGEEKLRF